MSVQEAVVAVIVAVAAVYMGITLMPGGWRAMLAARVGRVARRAGLPAWLVARVAGGVAKTGSCSGCGGGSRAGEIKKWARDRSEKA